MRVHWLLCAVILGVCVVGEAEASKRVRADIQRYDRAVAGMKARFAKTPAAPKVVSWVQKKLAHMVEVDQYMRGFVSTPGKKGYTTKETALFWQLMGKRWAAVDQGHTRVLKRLLAIHKPWFGISRFGKVASQNAWLLVQHADRDRAFQKRILKILATQYKKQEVNAKHYAYLYDRVAAFGDFLPQRFGTQGRCVAKGVWAPFPLEAPANIDKRRKEVGLGTLAAYKKRFVKICQYHRSPKRKSKAGLNQQAFHIHQAIGFLESWRMMKLNRKQRCLDGLKRSKEHFQKARKLLQRDFYSPLLKAGYRLHALLTKAPGGALPIVEIESFRMMLHGLLQTQKLNHLTIWHKAFMRCRRSR